MHLLSGGLVMKRGLVILLFTLSLISCNIPRPVQPSTGVIETAVAIARTSTAIQDFFATETAAANPVHVVPTPPIASPVAPTPAPTPTQINFHEKLGMPTWQDELNNGARWSLAQPNTDTPNVMVKVENGILLMTRSVPYGGKNWWLNYQTLKDFYLEGKFITQTCSKDDQYGLIFRAPNYVSGFGFYYTITCDGYFNLMRWDENGAANLFQWEKSDAILAGANQTNLFGIWAKQNLIRLYANGKLVKEVNDSSLPNKGHFGLFVDSRQTPGFTIQLDEITFWENPSD
jgi:hypothetical protein